MLRIDDAVTRILRVKFAMGLMDKNRPPLADRSLQNYFGSPEHRAVARQAVRESLCLLKNDHNILPLTRSPPAFTSPAAAPTDLGMQCGGWTRDWQGSMDNLVPGGTTIFAAIKAAASNSANITFSLDGSGAQGADVGVLVIGEKPYAEYMGDSTDLSLAKEDLDALANMKKAGIPVVTILLSGRPLILGNTLDQMDALIAAWLPGSKGEGVADILFGDAKPTGKLSRDLAPLDGSTADQHQHRQQSLRSPLQIRIRVELQRIVTRTTGFQRFQPVSSPNQNWTFQPQITRLAPAPPRPTAKWEIHRRGHGVTQRQKNDGNPEVALETLLCDRRGEHHMSNLHLRTVRKI